MNINVIYNEDCVGELGMTMIADGSVDMVVTDPPYKLVAGGKTSGNTSGIFAPSEASRTGKMFQSNSIKFSDWSSDVFRVLKDGSHCYVMVNDRNLQEMLNAFTKVGFKVLNVLFWDKGNVTPNKWYMKAGEFIVLFRKGTAMNINNMGDSTLLRYKNVIGNKVHPTEKPVDMIQRLIENSSNPGDVILDPFVGGGSSMIAAVNTGRNYIGFEMDKGYYDVAVKRVEAAKALVCPTM